MTNDSRDQESILMRQLATSQLPESDLRMAPLFLILKQITKEHIMIRSASAHWSGGIKDGQGVINTESGTLRSVPYSFAKRFGDERGTNPEELIGAAHSGCFAMALSGELSKHQIVPESIDVKAHVTIEKQGEGWAISTVHLDVSVSAPGADHNMVELAAKSAKQNCPVSKLLNAHITMNFNFVSEESQSLH